MIEKAEMVLGAKRIVIVCHDICEGIRYVPTCYNLLGLPRLISKEDEGEDDTADE